MNLLKTLKPAKYLLICFIPARFKRCLKKDFSGWASIPITRAHYVVGHLFR